MRLERFFEVDAEQDAVWAFITSPERVAGCLPGCDAVEEFEPGRYRASLSVKVGPIKTSFNLEVTAVEERAPEFAAYQTRGEEGGRASRLKADSTLTVRSLGPDKSEVGYTSEVSITGRLGKFGLGVMKKKAEAMSDQFIDAVTASLTAPAADKS